MNKKIILLICIIGLILITPICAKEVTAVVDDKGLIHMQNYGLVGTLHTCYGEITVGDKDYNEININDTIRYNTDLPFWSYYWDVEKVN